MISDENNNFNVIVYSTPNCSQCTMTKRKLTDDGLGYYEVNLSTLSRQAVDELIELSDGRQAPLVFIDRAGEVIDAWSGFRPDKISRLSGTARGV